MEMIKTRLALVCTLALMAPINNANAEIAADADSLFNWGEKTYPALLPEPEVTKTFESWFYRYYVKTDLYVGVNSNDSGVYLLYGKQPNAKPVYVESVASLLQQMAALNPPVTDPPANLNGSPVIIETPAQNDQPECDDAKAPQGIAYSQNGSDIKITTNGQCVAFPKTDVCLPKSPVPSGISVLKRMEIQSYQLSGVSFALPSIAQALEPQIKSNGNIKSCIRNAPAAFANLSFDLDGCFDVTERVKDFPSIVGLITLTPPVTMQLQGNFATETVADCFNTDALIVTDAVTNEVWDKKGAIFVKR